MSAVFVLGDRSPQKIVALLGAIPAEGLTLAHFVDGFVKRFACSEGKGLGHVADATANQFARGVRVCIRKGLHTSTNFWKEIT